MEKCLSTLLSHDLLIKLTHDFIREMLTKVKTTTTTKQNLFSWYSHQFLFWFGLVFQWAHVNQLTWTEGREDLVPECSEFTELLHSKAVLTGWLAGNAV